MTFIKILRCILTNSVFAWHTGLSDYSGGLVTRFLSCFFEFIRSKTNTNNVTAAATLVTAVATAVYGGIALCQLYTMREQLNASHRNDATLSVLSGLDKVCEQIEKLQSGNAFWAFRPVPLRSENGFSRIGREHIGYYIQREDIPSSQHHYDFQDLRSALRNLRLSVRVSKRWATEQGEELYSRLNHEINVRFDPDHWITSGDTSDSIVRSIALAKIECAGAFQEAIDDWAKTSNFAPTDLKPLLILDTDQVRKTPSGELLPAAIKMFEQHSTGARK